MAMDKDAREDFSTSCIDKKRENELVLFDDIIVDFDKVYPDFRIDSTIEDTIFGDTYYGPDMEDIEHTSVTDLVDLDFSAIECEIDNKDTKDFTLPDGSTHLREGT